MQKQSFMRADEVAQELGISKSHAYKVIHGLNEELQEKGYLTISGRVNREFFREKYYYYKKDSRMLKFVCCRSVTKNNSKCVGI